MSNVMTPSQQIRKIHGLLHHTGLTHSKIDIIYNAYGVEHVTDMTSDERDDFIQRLRALLRQKKVQEASPELRKKRSIVLRILSRIGVYDSTEPGCEYVAFDWKRVNAYLSDKRIAGKLLYEMNIEELEECARKLRSVERKQKKAIEEAELKKDYESWLARNN